MKTIIIGGGPAGILAAISAANKGDNVTILEKMEQIGKKIRITGKGRCNITNSADMSEFMKNIPGNARFLYSAFNNFTNQDIINLLNNENVETKVERGGRVFPKSDKANDVLKALTKILEKLKVEILTNSEVVKINVKENRVESVVLKNKSVIKADKIILATGGKSYPITGSTGDGYKIAENLGHTIITPKPALVPLTCTKEDLKVCKDLQGLTLKNVAIKVKANEKTIYEDFGEMLFTHLGISGPIVLSSSSIISRYKNYSELLKENKIKIDIDLKPALDEEKLELRIMRDFEENKNKQYKNSLDKLLPQKLIPIIVEKSGINPEKKVNEITKVERKKLVNTLKQLTLIVDGFRPIEEAIVTAGGINIKEINPKTMESKIIQGLYFAGEIIDVDALTGGFNLQIAYSTGYTAGLN